MAFSQTDCILTDEGYEIIKQKYKERIDELLEEMRKQHEKEELENEHIYHQYIKSQPNDTNIDYIIPSNEELPFN